MKYLFCCFILLSLFLVSTCSPSKNVAPSAADPSEKPEGAIQDDSDVYRSLADYLQRVPGVNVMGPEGNQMVTIRGINTFSSGIEPLFVIDGQAVGASYSQANNMINVKDIDYVRVLKGSDAAVYGVRGGNGVVLIFTK